MAITEFMLLILLILVTVFTIARFYNEDGVFGTGKIISGQVAADSFSSPFVTETNNKHIVLFYNTQPIAFRNGVAYNTRTHEVFNEPIKNIEIELGRHVPYELNVSVPYKTMRVVGGPYGDHKHHPNLFQSEKTLHPGEKFIVKEPSVVVILYL